MPLSRTAKTSKTCRGMTIVEVLVTGTLFAVVLTMVARAMVLGQRAQSNLSHKVDVVRKASMALDLLVRDAEMAQYVARLSYYDDGTSIVPLPPAATAVNTPDELRVRRSTGGATIYDLPHNVDIGYWRDPGDRTLHRTVYDTGPPQDKIVARDVNSFEFMVAPNPTTGLTVITARLKVSTLAEPVSTQFSLETGP